MNGSSKISDKDLQTPKFLFEPNALTSLFISTVIGGIGGGVAGCGLFSFVYYGLKLSLQTSIVGSVILGLIIGIASFTATLLFIYTLIRSHSKSVKSQNKKNPTPLENIFLLKKTILLNSISLIKTLKNKKSKIFIDCRQINKDINKFLEKIKAIEKLDNNKDIEKSNNNLNKKNPDQSKNLNSQIEKILIKFPTLPDKKNFCCIIDNNSKNQNKEKCTLIPKYILDKLYKFKKDNTTYDTTYGIKCIFNKIHILTIKNRKNFLNILENLEKYIFMKIFIYNFYRKKPDEYINFSEISSENTFLKNFAKEFFKKDLTIFKKIETQCKNRKKNIKKLSVKNLISSTDFTTYIQYNKENKNIIKIDFKNFVFQNKTYKLAELS